MLKLHKRQCFARVTKSDGENYCISYADKTFECMTLPSWELVSIWYQLGALLGFDHEDAKHELERLHWKNDQGELDEPSQEIIGRKHKKKDLTN